MAVSKVILNGVTLIDTTDKTVSVDKLLDGYTALKNDGTSITGSYVAPTFTTQSKTVSPTTSQQIVSPDAGYDGLSSVTVNAIPSSALLIILTDTSQGSVSQSDFVISSDSSGNNVINSAAEGDTIYLVYKKTSGRAYITIRNAYTLAIVDEFEFSSSGNSSYVMPNYPLFVVYYWSR